MTLYLAGYNGKPKTLAQLQAWSQWQNLDPEMARRVLALMDASIIAGSPLGPGEIFRSYATQRAGFLARHHVVSSGGCCTFEGKNYALNAGQAHMAPPGRSYHEATTSKQKALAVDFIGNLKFLAANARAYGLVEFSKVNSEPWHAQPEDIPGGRSRYVLANHDPLDVFVLPSTVKPGPTVIVAPDPLIVIRLEGVKYSDGKTTNDKQEVREFQLACNFWKWRDRMGRTLIVDGEYGPKSAEACMAMQAAIGVTADGIYGKNTRTALQNFLNAMVPK